MREYFDVFGAVEPATGEKLFVTEMPQKKPRKKRLKKGDAPTPDPPKEKGVKSRQFNNFIQKLSEKYPLDHILLLCDRAWWHRSKYTVIPKNVTLFLIPPATPEMNPIEQIWRELRTMGFHNKYFETLIAVKENFEITALALTSEKIQSITQRDWLPCQPQKIANPVAA